MSLKNVTVFERKIERKWKIARGLTSVSDSFLKTRRCCHVKGMIARLEDFDSIIISGLSSIE